VEVFPDSAIPQHNGLFDRAIHYHSLRRNKRFIPVKGAFTEANSSEKELVTEGEVATLLFDEAATLIQLLNPSCFVFWQNSEYRPLGSP